jgi:8-oxo-dGTP pyrophosphatase MutT (NUDIX family)
MRLVARDEPGVSDTELLAVYDEEGRLAGTKPRAQVHRDGDWHALVFVLAARFDGRGRKRFLLQLRSGQGDPYEGQIDVLAAGHVAASESVEDAAVREFQEEIGIGLRAEDLIELGRCRLELPSGVCRRVLQTFYLCRRTLDLSQATFNEEVGAVLDVDLEEFANFIDGKRRTVRGVARLHARGAGVSDMVLSQKHVSAYPSEVMETFRKCLRAVSKYLDSGSVERAVWD